MGKPQSDDYIIQLAHKKRYLNRTWFMGNIDMTQIDAQSAGVGARYLRNKTDQVDCINLLRSYSLQTKSCVVGEGVGGLVHLSRSLLEFK